MTKIVMGNVLSKLDTDRATLRIVRHHVAYRQRLMPPIEAQKLIKGFFSKHRRYGSGDIARLFADGSMCEQLEALGVTPETLTRNQFESTVRQRGVWDGWGRVVESDGTFPTGLLNHVQRALELRAGGIVATLEDSRSVPKRGQPWGDIDLYDYQREAVEAFIDVGRGVVNLPPRSGKTRIAVAVAAALGVPTIYIAPTVGVVEQTAKVFSELLPNKATIGLHSGLSPSARNHRKLLGAAVIVTTPKTALKIPNPHSRLLLIIDEFHHAAAKTWKQASEAFSSAYWRLGLTGTHFRADGKDLEMAGVLGRAIYSRSVGDMVELGRLVPARIAMLRVRGDLKAVGYDIYKSGVVEHTTRNKALATAANLLIRDCRRVLVLTKEIEHAQRLSQMIPGSEPVDGRDNERVNKMLTALADGTVKAVVGTSVIGEGRDVPAADALVYASGGQSKVKVVQDYFRALTASEGKKTAIVVDIADSHHPTLLDHAARRLQHYRGEKAFDAEVLEAADFERWLGDNRTF